MTLKVFLELIEIKAKTASVFPFLLGTFYALYHYQTVQWPYLLAFFIAMFIFNMAVDINDNYWDYKNADRTQAIQFREKTNVIGVNHLNITMIGWMIFSFILISAVIGIWVAVHTGFPVLWLGIIAFAIGFFYAGGPYPINRGPFGEFFSGFAMGFIIFLLAVYINVANQATFNWPFVWPILLTSGLSFTAISALLLANNICDYQEDIELGRHTLVRFLGIKPSLYLLAALYITGYITQLIAVVLGFLPWLSLLTLLLIPIVYQNTHQLFLKQEKKTTFIFAVRNLFLITLVEVIGFGLGLIIH